ncbi:MAG: hypothetical protein Q8916_03215 [Bacteroidota bacterium]|nr:hypothetical protein [Bacteroidota bacterium]MDP4229398.1 hypothetical protein [Bacteroidota bacterium]MDP4237353.1 hypothetical protein [Bacteroidota bacterium]
MNKSIFLSAVICCILFSFQAAAAQDTLHSRFGIAFGASNNIHSADFNALPGIPGGSTNFTTGDGSGLAISLLYEYPLNDRILFGVRLGYMDHSATLTAASEKADVIINGETKSGDYARSIDAVVSSFGLEPRVCIRAIKGLLLSAGLRIGLISSAKYIQRETAATGTFPDSTGRDTKSKIRNQYAGDLPNASSTLLQGVFSLGYEFPLNKKHTTFIVPEIAYTPALTNLIKDLSWKTNAVVYGVALKFSLD